MMDEKEFEEYLDRDSNLSRLYHAGATERAPESVVSNILARANEPVQAPRRTGSWHRVWEWLLSNSESFAPNWPRLIPASAIAMIAVVIVVGISNAPDTELRPSPLTEKTAAVGYDSNDTGKENLPLTVRSEAIVSQPKEQSTGSGPAIEVEAPLVAKEQGSSATFVPVVNPGASRSSETVSPPASAEAWVAEMESLLEHGRQEEARFGFYAFREQYPHHPVPDDLLKRLGM
ncbi:MAG: hypothetical protein GY731_11395 [Gammaproteobacteria bacterium]|nr:hypothetical protein [Gammaproteobacteria bacterium]